MRTRPLRRRSTLLHLALAVATVSLAACETNPTTGRSQFNLLSRDQEVQMGSELQPQFVQESGGEITDQVIRQYVSNLGNQLAAQTEADNPSLPWTFTVLNSQEINAFALPGGKVFITVGLLKEMTNEAQLAAVLGHEVGHVTARHVSERIGQAGIADIVIQAAAAGVGAATDSSVATEVAGTAFNYGGQMVVLKFSRDQESESDSLGMRYMTKLGYDPRGALQVQEILQRAMAASGGRGLEIMATHPYPETRIQRIQAELKKSPYKDMVGNPQYRLGEAEFRQAVLSRL